VTNFRALLFVLILAGALLLVSSSINLSQADQELPFEHNWRARPFHQTDSTATPYVVGAYSPNQIKTAYNLPLTGGAGTTIAIIVAFNYSSARSDLAVFCNEFNLPQTDLEIYNMSSRLSSNDDWASEAAMDVQWAHAIAPQAKILLVQARSDFDTDLISAVDYARSRSDVVSISMSWGGPEDNTVTSQDFHFTSNYGAVFFAASGDNGSAEIDWPAISPRVIAVGGTTLNLNSNGAVISETAWSGSGGGSSAYISKPAYQTSFGITGTKRTIPDVSYDANPSTGFPVHFNGLWQKFGGTSAGAPQWAAIHALGRSSNHTNLYATAKSNYPSSFRDIKSGSNGEYTAGTSYDYVTGLGSPLTVNFTPTIITTNYVTLLPAGQSRLLNATNRFTVTYTINGNTTSTFAQNGTLTLTTDPDTNITIAGQSTESTTQEKWVLNANATPATGKNMTLYYYDLLTQPASATIIGGGNPQNLTLTYNTAPSAASGQQNPQTATVKLDTSTQTIWPTTGTTLTIANPVNANQTERWTTQNTTTWLITSANQLPQKIVFYHEFLLNITGAQTSSRWYNSSETAQITLPVVSGRESGNQTGQRIAAYSIDSGAPIQIQPTTDTVNIQVLMTAAHQVQVTVKRQYQISLDASAAKETISITAPTISGDNYWYDEGTPVVLVLNGSENRLAGTGQRLSAFSVNGVQTKVSSLGQVNALNIASLTSPQQVSATTTKQYQLNTPSGSVRSITLPSVAGDAGWYDEGTTVTVTYDYSWGTSALDQSRLNALNYTVSQVTAFVLNRAGTGTFNVQITMTKPETITVGSVKQYSVTISGGNNIVRSAPSPTGDSFYDTGTILSATTDRFWAAANLDTRNVIVDYLLNRASSNFVRAETGTFTTPQITVDKAQQLAFTQITQYQLKTSSGSVRSISPPSNTFESGWYDQGTTVTVTYDYSWNASPDQSRLNAVNYTTSQGAIQALNRAGDGNFNVQVTMDKPEAITVGSVTQYLLKVSGGNNIAISQPSPTGDFYFDDGTALSVTTDRVWSLNNENTRQVLINYTINGPASNFIRSETGTFTTPEITMDKAQQVNFISVTQHKITFQVKNSDGEKTITPAVFQIYTSDAGIVDVPQFSLWLDSGIQFHIQSVIWQNVEVKPADSSNVTVSSPMTETVLCRVYDAKIIVTDHQGKPVSGAQVNVTLANQTSIQATTDHDGAVALPTIPQGTFNATAAYNGLATTISSDASIQTVATAVLPEPPLPITEIIIAAVIAVAVTGAAGYVIVRKRNRIKRI
jgi:hypothetical protein